MIELELVRSPDILGKTEQVFRRIAVLLFMCPKVQTDPPIFDIEIVTRECCFKQICFFLSTIQNFLYKLANKPICKLMLRLPLRAYGPTETLRSPHPKVMEKISSSFSPKELALTISCDYSCVAKNKIVNDYKLLNVDVTCLNPDTQPSMWLLMRQISSPKLRS